MSPDKLSPTDSRVQHKTTVLNGNEYHYLLATPSSPPRATIFLIHGWPDLAFGWRYQIPFLQSLGFRVVAPDMIGYGRSAAPQGLENYTMKRAADDMAALAKEIGVSKIIVLGHDWGGAIIWKIALWHPDLVVAAISVCTPYTAPSTRFVGIEDMVEKFGVENFRYQIQLAGPDVQREIVGKTKLRQFLNALYGASSAAGKDGKREVGFMVTEGVKFGNLEKLRKSKIVSDEELDFYAEEYSRSGMRGPLNWYRTRELNYKDELPLAEKVEKKGLKVEIPTLFILAKKDMALPPKMSRGMGRHFKDLRIREVDAQHWALWEATDEVNGHLKSFLDDFLNGNGGKEPKALL